MPIAAEMTTLDCPSTTQKKTKKQKQNKRNKKKLLTHRVQQLQNNQSDVM